ncbi:AbrB family transcriptional regulator [Streptomyces sp. NPDC087263]|uniref:AbrB family transcriptional regulator n=1 Tax=Streptomyces sp. NPDC087263 TaxID=3365773 RepID=UPI00381F4953
MTPHPVQQRERREHDPSGPSAPPATGLGTPAGRAAARTSAGRWAIIVLGGYLAGATASALGLPSPYLLAALLVGAALSLSGLVRDRLPEAANRSSQAVAGALMGSYLTPAALAAAAPLALPLTVVTVATLVLSVTVAWCLACRGRITRPSAVLGMAPGGSAAIVTCADELGADVRLVAFTQYLRVGLVASTAPLVARWLASPPADAGATAPGGGNPVGRLLPLVAGSDQDAGLVVLALVAVCGAHAGRRLRLPTPVLIGPMMVALAATMSGLLPGFAPTGVLQNGVFVLVGLDVGVRFTRATVVRVRSLLPSLVAATAAVCLGCAGMAWVFAKATGSPVVDAYLATTPGGINAVLATAVTSHADVALVSTVQSLRLLIVVLAMPWVIRLVVPSGHPKRHVP